MDRNFEKVFTTVFRQEYGELHLKREYLRYYGYHSPRVKGLTPQQIKAVLYESVWRRLGLDNLLAAHQDLALYIFTVELFFSVNLVPHLRSILNSVLPDEIPGLDEQGQVINSEVVKSLESYLIWKSDRTRDEPEFLDGMYVIKLLLEAHLLVEMTRYAAFRPEGEEYLHNWLLLRKGDNHAIEPEFLFTRVHKVCHSRQDEELEPTNG